MSLRGHVFFSVILALAVGLSALGAVACWQARRSVEHEMHMALDAGDRIVDNALLSLPRAGTDAYLARLVRSFDGNRHVRVMLMRDGRPLAVSRLAAPEAAPRWFVRLLEIPPEARRDVSPLLAGHLLIVSTDPHNEISEAWMQFRDGALILALFSLLVLTLLHLAMARVTRSLDRLMAGFEAVGSGIYAARIAAQGPRELFRLATGFNRMSERLSALEEANLNLNAQILTVQEEERADLARDLHDEMGPFLFAMRVDAEGIARIATESGNTAIAGRAQAMAEAVTHIQRQVRSVLRQLQPADLADVGLAQAIANLATFWQRHHAGLAIVLDVAAAEDGFSREVDAAVYRLVQEALTNAARHGAAHTVWVRITAGGGILAVTIEDDGRGLGDAQSGMGLKGMRERLQALSGTLELCGRDGGGARLAARIPYLSAMVPA